MFFFFEPTRNNVLKLPLATLMIPLSFLGQSADFKKCSIPFVFIFPPCQKDFLILLVPARKMLQNTIQTLHWGISISPPIFIDSWLPSAKLTLVWFGFDNSSCARCKECIWRWFLIFSRLSSFILYLFYVACCFWCQPDSLPSIW